LKDPLITYLQDQHRTGEPLGEFATNLLVEVESDRDVLANLTESLGGSAGGPKEWSAWLVEKVSRLKLKPGSGNDLETFEALEFLVLGIHGKWALWRALTVAAEWDSRLHGVNFRDLITRAESQHAKVDTQRLVWARGALCPAA
jgi:hypothetical protein